MRGGVKRMEGLSLPAWSEIYPEGFFLMLISVSKMWVASYKLGEGRDVLKINGKPSLMKQISS